MPRIKCFSALRESFKDIIQELMEAKLDVPITGLS